MKNLSDEAIVWGNVSCNIKILISSNEYIYICYTERSAENANKSVIQKIILIANDDFLVNRFKTVRSFKSTATNLLAFEFKFCSKIFFFISGRHSSSILPTISN